MSGIMTARMLLVVDAGNTQTHLGTFRGEALVEHWRFATVRSSTADELGAALRNLLELRGMTFDDIQASIISSTVPDLVPEWTEMAERYLGHAMPSVGPGIRTGMPIRIDNPREVGADRLVNAIAAYDRVQDTCIVVDFGTATSFDVYSGKGEFIGGAIAPGVQTSMDALAAKGAKLPTVELLAPRSPVGRSTTEAMQSGAVYGFAGQVDRILEEIAGELEATPVVIATGGLANAVVRECRRIDHHDPWLTLKGLRLVWQRNT